MNWRKGIRDIIHGIISRMELISEVVENDGHIIVYMHFILSMKYKGI